MPTSDTQGAATARPWIAAEERTEGDNFHTSIYENDYKGFLIARCNQNGRYPEHVALILAAGERKAEAAGIIKELRA
mgnify:CR=1 FL=1